MADKNLSLKELEAKQDELRLHIKQTEKRVEALDEQIQDHSKIYYPIGSVFQFHNKVSLFNRHLYWMVSLNNQIYFMDLETGDTRSEGFTSKSKDGVISKNQIDSRMQSNMRFIRSSLNA